MKLIDKYLLRTFLVPLVYCLLAFVMIYLIFDLFDNLDRFLEGKTPPLLVAKYYVIFLPSVMIRIVPISLLLAVLYALYQLTKNNELTAMKASGVSIVRMMVPFVSVGLLASVLLLAVNESIGPSSAFWCKKFIAQQRRIDEGIDVYKKEVGFALPETGRDWYVGEFDMRTFEMKRVEVTQQRPDRLSNLYKVWAQRARWVDEKWWFSDLRIQKFDEESNPKGPPDFLLESEMTSLVEKPRDILNEIKDPEYLASWELAEYIRLHPTREKSYLARLSADLHSRLSMPWSCLIVTLLGIPFGNQTGRKGAATGIGMVLLMFFAYYILTYVGLWLAKDMLVPPWLGGWLPNLTFFTLGVGLVWRMR
jgi:LPS export ABC transporter permease LptG